jgi:hypothetical protein
MMMLFLLNDLFADTAGLGISRSDDVAMSARVMMARALYEEHLYRRRYSDAEMIAQLGKEKGEMSENRFPLQYCLRHLD